MTLTFEEYQSRTGLTAIYPNEKGLEYTALGLAGEAGEVANKVKKIIRGDVSDLHEMVIALADELGDVLWYVSELASNVGISLDTIAERNLEKLQARKDQGTLRGSGDTR